MPREKQEVTEERIAEMIAEALRKHGEQAGSGGGRKIADEIRMAVKSGVEEGLAAYDASAAERERKEHGSKAGLFERVKNFLRNSDGDDFWLWLEGVDPENPKVVLEYLKDHNPAKYRELMESAEEE